MSRKVTQRRVCGSCLYYSWWTGDCCQGGEFREVHPDRKACGEYDRAEDYDLNPDSASYDPEDDNY